MIASVALIGIGAGAALLLAGGGDDSPKKAAAPTKLSSDRVSKAFEKCSADDVTKTLTLADEGHTIVVDTRSNYGATGPFLCVLGALDTSAATVSAIGATTAMMGLQDATENGITYRWSYHPDNGLNIVIQDAD